MRAMVGGSRKTPKRSQFGETGALERFPKAVEYLDYFQEQTAASRQTVAGWSEAISERGLWVLFDGIGGLFGLALFGSAWGDVKNWI